MQSRDVKLHGVNTCMTDRRQTPLPRSKFWKNANFNPWGAHVGDCAIRGISAATGLDYRVVCKMLHVSYKNGQGLIRDTGIELNDIERVFDQYFDIVEDFYDNTEFVPPEMVGSKEAQELEAFDSINGIEAASKTTLEEFIRDFKDQGVFLVSLVGNPDAQNPVCRRGGHIVCVRCARGKPHCFIDTFSSHEMFVDAYMRVARMEPVASPLHWKYDFQNKKFIL